MITKARLVVFVVWVVLAPAWLASAAAAAPCTAMTTGGQWLSYGHDPANTRFQPAETGLGPASVATLRAAWVFSTDSTGDGTGFNTTPVVSGGCAFIGSYGGVTYALDARTGHVVWQRKLPAPNPGSGGVIVGAAAIHGNAVIYLVNEFAAPYAIALNRPRTRDAPTPHATMALPKSGERRVWPSR